MTKHEWRSTNEIQCLNDKRPHRIFFCHSGFVIPSSSVILIMSVLVDTNTRLVVQGITGSAGGFHTRQCMEYGTNVVAGVTPGKGGQKFDDKVPVFDTVAEARAQTGCIVSMIFVPAAGAADSILEAVDAGESANGREKIASDRSKLSGDHHARRGQDRHHAGLHS